jgi:hypothetical protein
MCIIVWRRLTVIILDVLVDVIIFSWRISFDKNVV